MPRWPTSTECPGEPAMETSSRRGSQLSKTITKCSTFKIRKYKNVADSNNLVYHMFIHCSVIWTPAPRACPPAGRSRAARRRTGRATASGAATAGTICPRGTRLGTGEENICCRFSKIFYLFLWEASQLFPWRKGSGILTLYWLGTEEWHQSGKWNLSIRTKFEE